MTDDPKTDDLRPVLGHFTTYRLTPRFWELDASERRDRGEAWFRDIGSAGEVTRLYLTAAIESESDVLVWSTATVTDGAAPGDFLTGRAAVENRHRGLIDPVHVLWGMTRPSEYSRAAKSAQEIDPFADDRARYLVMYPFTKTADWYLFGRETRQGMMNEHIRIGKQFSEITQLLLYSFGLQDQEFVVVYETEDLPLFSRLVYDLRSTEARRYTKGDTPLHTGVLLSPEEWAKGLAGGDSA